VPRISELDRSRIRRHDAENFSRERMVENYIRVYREVFRQE